MEIEELHSRIEYTLSQVKESIQLNLATSGIAPEYQEALCLALPTLFPEVRTSTNDRWALLPELCYRACGGKADTTVEITAAWYLYYSAAFYMDHAEDSLERRDKDGNHSPGVLINIASGYYFLANLLLLEFVKSAANPAVAMKILEGFHSHLLRMCEGQQRDLLTADINLKEYYAIARKKSGVFFSLACWAGAMLAEATESELEDYAQFGSQIGVILQILDDLEDWNDLRNGGVNKGWQNYHRTLPAVYAMEVVTDEQRMTLRNLVQEMNNHPSLEHYLAFQGILEKAGAGFYLLTALMREFEEARLILTNRGHDTPADKMLLGLISGLLKF